MTDRDKERENIVLTSQFKLLNEYCAKRKFQSDSEIEPIKEAINGSINEIVRYIKNEYFDNYINEEFSSITEKNIHNQIDRTYRGVN